MRCPHCLVAFHIANRTCDPDEYGYDADAAGVPFIDYIGKHGQHHRWVERIICPACGEVIVSLVLSQPTKNSGFGDKYPDTTIEQKRLIWPRGTARPPVPPEVADEFKTDYLEACLVFADSPKASAALSRRCLQLLLREKLGAPKETLYKEIQWAISSGGLPSAITDLLDAPRKIGNRAAHPTLSDVGVIVDVEPWEAEWCLEVIEALYDHIFVIPARNEERLERLQRRT